MAREPGIRTHSGAPRIVLDTREPEIGTLLEPREPGIRTRENPERGHMRTRDRDTSGHANTQDPVTFAHQQPGELPSEVFRDPMTPSNGSRVGWW